MIKFKFRKQYAKVRIDGLEKLHDRFWNNIENRYKNNKMRVLKLKGYYRMKGVKRV